MLNDLKYPKGARTNRKRKGQGPGTGNGKTAGRGHKGQKARKSGHVRRGFEGGQMPLIQRVPKLRGFTNPFRVEYQAINLDTIAESGLSEVTPESLLARGLVSKGALIKVLGRGELGSAVTVKAHAFSKSAEEAITGAGGTVEVLPKPFGVRPAHGSYNQHTNR